MSEAFTILGLPVTATPDEIKARWRELAMVHHPDRGGDAATFNAICDAYKIAMEEASAPKECPRCLGSGKVKQSRGFSSVDMLCPACGGSGRV